LVTGIVDQVEIYVCIQLNLGNLGNDVIRKLLQKLAASTTDEEFEKL